MSESGDHVNDVGRATSVGLPTISGHSFWNASFVPSRAASPRLYFVLRFANGDVYRAGVELSPVDGQSQAFAEKVGGDSYRQPLGEELAAGEAGEISVEPYANFGNLLFMRLRRSSDYADIGFQGIVLPAATSYTVDFVVEALNEVPGREVARVSNLGTSYEVACEALWSLQMPPFIWSGTYYGGQTAAFVSGGRVWQDPASGFPIHGPVRVALTSGPGGGRAWYTDEDEATFGAWLAANHGDDAIHCFAQSFYSISSASQSFTTPQCCAYVIDGTGDPHE